MRCKVLSYLIWWGLSVLLLGACQTPQTPVEVWEERIEEFETHSSEPVTKLPEVIGGVQMPKGAKEKLAYMKAQLKPRADFWDPDAIEEGEKELLPLAFVAAEFYPFMEQQLRLEDLHLEYAQVRAGEYHIYKDYFFFSLYMYNEYCCRVTYAFTSHSDSLDLIDVIEMGAQGGDGPWVRMDFGSWTNDNLLHIIRAEQETVLEKDSGSRNRFDTIWFDLKVDQSGKFHRQKLDSSTFLTGFEDFD